MTEPWPTGGRRHPVINREAIRSGAFADMIAEAAALGLFQPLSDDERRESRRRTLAAAEPGADVWVFGYGSLMWNPAFHFAERRPGHLYGYHRRFCLWTPLGRGSPDNPGLILGLDHGGSCRGVVFRLGADQVEEELDIVWQREMIAGSYRPHWATVRTPAGPVRAIAFVINQAHERYAGRLPLGTVVDHLATAAGRLGSCAEYLENTVAHLDELGINDGPMHALLERVRRRQGASAVAGGSA